MTIVALALAPRPPPSLACRLRPSLVLLFLLRLRNVVLLAPRHPLPYLLLLLS
jgi:hypothetical protein